LQGRKKGKEDGDKEITYDYIGNNSRELAKEVLFGLP
jgi:hypothetical protein